MAKLSDEQFLSFLRANAGIYARTARSIQKELGIEITRQSVRERALKHPDILQDIEDDNIDAAEEKLKYFLNPPAKDDVPLMLQWRTAELIVRTKGKKRGWVERSELTGSDGKSLTAPALILREAKGKKPVSNESQIKD